MFVALPSFLKKMHALAIKLFQKGWANEYFSERFGVFGSFRTNTLLKNSGRMLPSWMWSNTVEFM